MTRQPSRERSCHQELAEQPEADHRHARQLGCACRTPWSAIGANRGGAGVPRLTASGTGTTKVRGHGVELRMRGETFADGRDAIADRRSATRAPTATTVPAPL